MSDIDCKCPKYVGEPFPYITYTCEPSSIYINYIMSQLLIRSNYYNYLQTGVNRHRTSKINTHILFQSTHSNIIQYWTRKSY